MFKAIIIEIKEKYIIVMKEGGELVKLNKKSGIEVGETIFCFEEDIYIEKRVNKNLKTWLIPLSAVAILAIILINPFKNIFSPNIQNTYAVLTFDVNPSIEFNLDDLGRIIDVKGINDDGNNLDIQSIKGLPLEEGVTKLKEILTSSSYLENGNSVLVGFSFTEVEDIQYEEMVQNTVKNTFVETDVAFIKGNEKNIAMANEQGISLGKYEALLKLDEDGIEDALENLTTQELLELLKTNNSNLFLNEEILDELEDEIEDRIEGDNEEEEEEEDDDDDENEQSDDAEDDESEIDDED